MKKENLSEVIITIYACDQLYILSDKRNATTSFKVILFKQLFRVMMLK